VRSASWRSDRYAHRTCSLGVGRCCRRGTGAHGAARDRV